MDHNTMGSGREWPRLDVVSHLRTSSMFGDLDEAVLETLAECLAHVTVRAGEVVMREGEVGGDVFIVVAGRLVVSTSEGGLADAAVAHLPPGTVVGEMSLLSGSPRSATVRALRDSELLRLSSEDFQRIVLDDPHVLLDITRTVVDRLDRSIHHAAPALRRSVLSVVPTGTRPGHREFAAAIARALGPSVSTAVVDHDRLNDQVAADATDADMTSYLHRLEDTHDYTVLVADEADTEWTRRCIRQADINFVVGRAGGSLEPTAAEASLHSWSSSQSHPVPVHLVLIQERAVPDGTPALLAERQVDRHHHVRLGRTSDYERLARIVQRSTVGLVLSGGGARGFAHIGVLKALLEADIPIDHVGGASIGSSVAANHAMGWDWQTVLEWERYVTVDRGSLIDLSFPAVALARGDKLTSGMRRGYGDSHIEDLWTDFFCVSTDLTAGRLRVHTTGPVWHAVRASVAIPGIFPPVRAHDGHVLVDGGVVNNLPTDVMREVYRPATVIAVDLRSPLDMPASELSPDGVMSGWRVAGRRYAPWKTAMAVPRMVDVLSRATALSGNHNAEYADLVLRPPIYGVGALDFVDYRIALDAGYRHAQEVLEMWDRPAWDSA